MTDIHHASVGGEEGVNHRFYKGGEFMPFYVPRIFMPQIGPDDGPKLLRYFIKMGVGFQFDHVDAKELKPHQHVNLKRVHTMPAWALAKFCLVSDDGFILDGHHRWFAHKQLGTPVPVIRMAVPFTEAISILQAFPDTTHEAL